MDTVRKFNVLVEPWIPVTLCDGTTSEYGIYQTLENAEKIEKIRDDNSLEKVAIMRLLTAFLTDAYHLKNKQDRLQLYNGHCFDMEIIRSYVNKCQIEYGASFDLFDHNKPFMVQSYDYEIDKESTLKSAANLCMTVQSGNNPLHWRHTDEAHFEGMTPSKTLRSVLSLYTFSPAMSGGYPSSVNNTPPVYYLPAEDNLFKSLSMCIRSESELGNISMSGVPCAWNMKTIIRKGAKIANMSFVYAMTFQPRRVVLKVDDDGLIRTCFFAPGMDYKGDELWKDPFVAYFKKKDGTMGSVKPQLGRDLWRDIGNITATSCKTGTLAPAVIYPINKHGIANVYSAGIITNQAALVQILDDYISLPKNLLDNEYLSDQIQADMELVERIYQNISAYKDSKGTWQGIFADIHVIVPELKNLYLFLLHNVLTRKYFVDVANADVNSFDWQSSLRIELCEILNDAINKVCDRAERLASDWKEIKLVEQDLGKFRGYSRNLLKQSMNGEVIDNGRN